MAASVTKTERTHKGIKKITWAWTAHTDGVVAADTDNCQTDNQYTGEMVRLVTVPGTGDDKPDDNYTVKVLDEDSVDVLMGGGASRDEANTEQVAASSLGVAAYSKLSLYVSGAGSGNKGTVHLYIR